MNKYVFVGDIHGKWVEVERALDEEGHIVFVGDIIDSYEYSTAEHERCFKLIFEAIRKGKATCLYGNHELSYYVDRMHCSGWNSQHNELMQDIRPEVEELFEHYLIIGKDVLVTHAGLTKQLWDDYDLDLNRLSSTLEMWVKNYESPAYNIGFFRGGYSEYGGIFWCDFRKDFIPIPGLTQIFGHTRGDDTMRRMGSNWCIDCLDGDNPQFLEMMLDG